MSKRKQTTVMEYPGALLKADRMRQVRERRNQPDVNALGILLEARFSHRSALVHTYSALEHASGVSREAISRYVSTRADRHRFAPADVLAAIAAAAGLSLCQVCSAAAMGTDTEPSITPEEAGYRTRVLAPYIERLTPEQVSMLAVFLRSMLADDRQ